MNQLSEVGLDFWQGLKKHRIWIKFAWLDIKQRYRRTAIGPFWTTISFLATALMLSLVYSTLFNINDKHFVAYIMSGLAVWGFISTLIGEGCYTYTGSSTIILERKLPFAVHALRLVTRNLIVFAHNLLALIAAMLVLQVKPTIYSLAFFPALACFLITGVGLAMLLGLACVRYRDLTQLVMLIVTMTFFITPIFWKKEMLARRAFVADYNPLAHFVEIMRAPLLGQAAPMVSWYVCIAICGLVLLVALLVCAHYQRRLTYWL